MEGYVPGWGGGAPAHLSDRRTVDLAGIDGVALQRDADAITNVRRPARKALRVVHRQHDRAELLFSNYSNAIDDFDPSVAHRLLTSAVHRRHVVADRVRVVRRQGWDGVQIDLESLRRNDGTGLVRFTDALRAALPASTGLSMAVMAEGSRGAYVRHGYRLERLDAIDRFVLMAYDQHGPGWSGPGPIGALAWAGPHLAPLAAEWSAHTADGTLWWSDQRSYTRRVAIAHDLRLHGVAVWQLASADPLRG